MNEVDPIFFSMMECAQFALHGLQEGQMLHAEVEVSKSSRAGGAAGPWVTFKTCCRSEDGTILVDGEALSRMPSGVIVRPIL